MLNEEMLSRVKPLREETPPPSSIQQALDAALADDELGREVRARTQPLLADPTRALRRSLLPEDRRE